MHSRCMNGATYINLLDHMCSDSALGKHIHHCFWTNYELLPSLPGISLALIAVNTTDVVTLVTLCGYFWVVICEHNGTIRIIYYSEY